MNRRLALLAAATALLAAGAAGYVGYARYFRAEPPAPAPEHVDRGARLPTPEEFDTLAATDPVAALDAGLTRYQREVRNGMRCTLEMQERVKGEPKHPAAPPVQVVELGVRGDAPDPTTGKTRTEVLMRWKQGAKRVGFAEVAATLYSERPEPDGLDGKFVTWRPNARALKLSSPVPPNAELAKGESRYCVRDAGIYRTMLRTHEAWKARKAAGEFQFEYLGLRAVEKVGGRECHVVRRICPRVELDAFELGGTASTDPKVVAAEGFTEVVIYLDRERWLQVATETFRTEPDGTKVTVGTYHFRDVDLNPTFAPDTFTVAGLKK